MKLPFLAALAALALPATSAAQTPCTPETCADVRVQTTPLQTVVTAGMPIMWKTTVVNNGPAAARVKVENALPSTPGTSWDCVAIRGAQCGGASGRTSIAETVTLPAGGSVEYQIRFNTDPCARGPRDAMLTARVSVLDKVDPVLADNEDMRTVTGWRVEVGLAVAVDDGKASTAPGEVSTYAVRVGNHGPSCAKGLTIEAPLLPAFTGLTWTCAGEGGATCAAPQGSGALRQGGVIPPSGVLRYTIRAPLQAAFTGTLRFPVSAINDEFGGQVNRVEAADVTQVARPLDCSRARASVETVWPPDHKMVAITVAGTPAPAKIASVKQDEPADAAGDGSTGADAVVLPDGSATVRAERAGGGDGRVYHLGFQAVDASGARCQGVVKTCVPKAEGQACADGGPAFESTARLAAPPIPPRPPPIRRK